MDTTNIGVYLKDRRISLKLTMKNVADYVGVSESTISRWESGEIKNMKRDKVFKLSTILDIDPAIIMGWTTVPNKDDPYIVKLQSLLKDATPDQKDQILRVAEALLSK